MQKLCANKKYYAPSLGGGGGDCRKGKLSGSGLIPTGKYCLANVDGECREKLENTI